MQLIAAIWSTALSLRSDLYVKILETTSCTKYNIYTTLIYSLICQKHL
jgi:hypothetical protein